MSIQAVRAVPYAAMKDYLSGDPTSLIAAQAAFFDRVWIISITNASAQSPPLVKDGPDCIALQFDDVEDKYDVHSGLTKPRDPQFVYFDEAMARKICEFVKRAHESNEESNDLLVVNCHMGVSRSGAVADFVRSACHLDYDMFRRLNPQVNPNTLVKNLLHHTWEEMGQ